MHIRVKKQEFNNEKGSYLKRGASIQDDSLDRQDSKLITIGVNLLWY